LSGAVPQRQPGTSAATLARMENETVAVVEPHEIELVQDELLDELLVEEISIDGMCGVY
jgi:mycofactocin precursor